MRTEMRLTPAHRKRVLTLIDEADQAGVSQAEITKALAPIYGRSRVEQLIHSVRKARQQG